MIRFSECTTIFIHGWNASRCDFAPLNLRMAQWNSTQRAHTESTKSTQKAQHTHIPTEPGNVMGVYQTQTTLLNQALSLNVLSNEYGVWHALHCSLFFIFIRKYIQKHLYPLSTLFKRNSLTLSPNQNANHHNRNISLLIHSSIFF